MRAGSPAISRHAKPSLALGRAHHAKYVNCSLKRHFGADEAVRALLKKPCHTLSINELPVCKNGYGAVLPNIQRVHPVPYVGYRLAFTQARITRATGAPIVASSHSSTVAAVKTSNPLASSRRA